MAVMRSDSNVNLPAPPSSPTRLEPPSPIPRAAGSRSAANEILVDYLERTLQVPDLSLPEPQFSVVTHNRRMPDEISLRSLVSGESDSGNRVLKSAREFGAVRIKGHGISVVEIRALVRGAERVFGILQNRDTGYRRDVGGRFNNKEEIVWVRSGKERMDWAREYMGAELFRNFSERVENVSSKLEVIAEQLGQVFMDYLGKQPGKGDQERPTALSIYKYNHNHNHISAQRPAKEEHSSNSCDHILSLHLPAKQCKYWLESDSGQSSFCFSANPDIIIFTVGRLLEEWSLGEFKCVEGEMIHQPERHASFSLELKCSSLSLKQNSSKTPKIISIADQILIGLMIIILHHIFKFLWS